MIEYNYYELCFNKLHTILFITKCPSHPSDPGIHVEPPFGTARCSRRSYKVRIRFDEEGIVRRATPHRQQL